jgi:septum formation protein
MKPIILASQSPRRKQLLEWAEIPFNVLVKTTDESYPAGIPAEDVPVYIARNKALVIQNMLKADAGEAQPVILAADTVVVLDDTIIGKPANREDAVNILLSLSGKVHRVITGVVLLHAGGETAFADITEVTFNQLTKEQVEFYVDKYQPYDKAGAYAIQEWIGVTGIKSIKGDFYNVMGLPVSRVVKALANMA